MENCKKTISVSIQTEDVSNTNPFPLLNHLNNIPRENTMSSIKSELYPKFPVIEREDEYSVINHVSCILNKFGLRSAKLSPV